MKKLGVGALAIVVVGLTACTGGKGSDGSGGPKGGGGQEENFDVVINSETCIRRMFPVFDYQEELKSAIETGDAPCAKWAVENGARADIKINTDPFVEKLEWPVHFALESSRLFFASTGGKKGFEVVKVLVDAGADVNVRNAEGQTALQRALIDETLSRYSIVSAYIIQTRKADLEVLDGSGDTVLLGMLKRKHRPTVDKLIQNGANVAARTRAGETALQLAIDGNFEDLAVTFVAQRGLDPMIQDRLGDNSLHKAARLKFLALAKAIIAKRVNLNVQNGDRETALLLAVEASANPVARELMAAGADVNLASNAEAPVHAALTANNDELATLLVARIADVNARNSSGATPLILATQYASVNLVKALLDRGADARMTDGSKYTPLMLALRVGDANKAGVLVSRSDVDQKGPGGRPALFFATSVPDLSMLLAARAQIDIRGDDGQTPLALFVGLRADMATHLINAGADVQWRAGDGQGLLHRAIQADSVDVARLLLTRGVDPNGAAYDRMTPVFYAQSVAALDLLVNAGAQVNQVTADKRTALFLRVSSYVGGQEPLWPLIERLVYFGADVNLPTPDRETLLHLAVSGQPLLGSQRAVSYPKLVGLLLTHGASVNAQDASRNTPLHVADTDVEVDLLLRGGADRRLTNADRKTAAQLRRDEEAALNFRVGDLTDRIADLERRIAELPANSPARMRLERDRDGFRADLNLVNTRLNMVKSILALLA